MTAHLPQCATTYWPGCHDMATVRIGNLNYCAAHAATVERLIRDGAFWMLKHGITTVPAPGDTLDDGGGVR